MKWFLIAIGSFIVMITFKDSLGSAAFIVLWLSLIVIALGFVHFVLVKAASETRKIWNGDYDKKD